MTSGDTLIALLLSLASTTALAQTYPGYDWVPPATATRAQVIEDLARARANGELRSFESMTGPRTTSNLTREQVREALLQARTSGEHGRLNAEAHAFTRPGTAGLTVGRR